MIVEIKNKIIFLFLLSLTNVFFAQTQTKNDTISCLNMRLVIEYPKINKITIDNYEEGVIKIINCPLDTAGIIIHCGAMMILPLIDTTNATIYSRLKLSKDIRSIKGYYMQDGVKKYFREDDYLKYRLTVLYLNVGETKLEYYEHSLNDIKIYQDGILLQDYK